MADVYERSTADSQAYRSLGNDPLRALLDRLPATGLLGTALAIESVVAAVGLVIGGLGSGLVAFAGSLAFVFALTTTIVGAIVVGVVYARRLVSLGVRAGRRRLADR